MTVQWDPQQYLRYAGERGRPFNDLLTRVRAQSPALVVDLGCGPGNLTVGLLERWPDATVIGVDSSAEMIAEAQRTAGADARLQFVQADLRAWEPPGPVDVFICNATLQWVPDHLPVLDRWADRLAPAGWIAFQVPGNFDSPSHQLLRAMCNRPRWRERLSAVADRAAVEVPEVYLERLAGLGLAVDVWETTYFHVLPGEDAVLEWMKGTGLRPVLGALAEAEQKEFLDEYGELLREAFPRRDFGTVLPFRRIFAVATKEVRP